MSATYTIQQWARYALVGDPDAATPTNTQLGPAILSVTRTLSEQNPCIGTDPLNTLTGGDLDAYTEWAGYAIAAAYITSPAGAMLSGASGGTVQVKAGPVTRTRKDADPVAIAQGYRNAAASARLRVSCIGSAVKAANAADTGLLDVVGRRRTIGEPDTVQGLALGSGRRDLPNRGNGV